MQQVWENKRWLKFSQTNFVNSLVERETGVKKLPADAFKKGFSLGLRKPISWCDKKSHFHLFASEQSIFV